MKRAINYMINQWKFLKNILKDGTAEISNILCEQRMKPIKLLLNNYMNIRSKASAEKTVFTFSQIESYRFNNLVALDYLKHLFECILHGKYCDKKVFLPCFLNNNVKSKFFPYRLFFQKIKLVWRKIERLLTN